MGIRITTDDRGIKVWRSDKGQYPSYAVQVSKKEGDTWINDYQKVHFKGGADIPNGTVIQILDAFPALESWVKDGQQYKRKDTQHRFYDHYFYILPLFFLGDEMIAIIGFFIVLIAFEIWYDINK